MLSMLKNSLAFLRLHRQLNLPITNAKFGFVRRLFSRQFAQKITGIDKANGLLLLPDQYVFETLQLDLGITQTQDLDFYLDEAYNNRTLRQVFEENQRKGYGNKWKNWDDYIRRISGSLIFIYAMLRIMQPRVVVETGVAEGSMTSWMLAALVLNKTGKLVSIDLPAIENELTMDRTVVQTEVGLWIPDDYKSQWEYLEGDAKELLPKILIKEEVECFMHDSLHTRSHMLFEYALARNLMRENALIISDDIDWNNAFINFLATNELRGYTSITNPSLGGFINKFDAYERSVGLGVIRR